VAGCGFGAVSVEPYEREPGTEQVCAALVEELPDRLRDAVRRDVRPGQEGTAAWGRPAIVLRCGVPMPPEYRPDAQLLVVDDVAWLPVDGEGGTFFTALERTARVEVAVPEGYEPEGGLLAELAPAITSAVPLSADPSAGAAPSRAGAGAARGRRRRSLPTAAGTSTWA